MNLTGPLGKQYCAVFKYMSLFALFMVFISVVSVIYNLVNSKNVTMSMFMLVYIVVYLMMYIQNRLLYNICLQ